jgi:creatinine amidohydrolase
MPTDLAFRLGARQAIFRFLEATRGEGWWGEAEMAEYYADQAAGADPFGWVKLHRLLPDGGDYPFDHAGVGETSLMLALAPEAVDMVRLGENTGWYTASAGGATRETGERGCATILAHLRAVLGV